MTPGARIAAAIEILDTINAGGAAEKTLTTWARTHRFAGSKDRAAIRDYVFDVLRARRSLGDGTGRALMMRLLDRDGHDVDAFFTGDGYAPAALADDERVALAQPLTLPDAATCDVPDWLWPQWLDSLTDQAQAVGMAQQARADVFLRVNLTRGSVADAQTACGVDGIMTQAHPTINGCLRVTENARRVRNAAAYLEGLVELQDASSQFAITAVPVPNDARLLDYCAGGGGKALGFADRYQATVFAHDISPNRMADLPVRAARAGLSITPLLTKAVAANSPFDVVFCDAPCSGSGTWRRTPDAKWRLTQDRLTTLQQTQAEVLAVAAPLVGTGGMLVYATCSVLRAENDDVVTAFCTAHPEWQQVIQHQLLPSTEGDGFFLCCMTRRIAT